MSADISDPVRQHRPIVHPPRPGPSPARAAGLPDEAAAAAGPAPAWTPGQDSAVPSPWGGEDGERPVISRSLLARTTDLINEILEGTRRRLKFNVHEGTGRIWVQVIDTRTQEVIKEIPPERYLDLVARIWQLVGILVDEKA